MAEHAEHHLARPAPVARPSGIPRMSRLPVLKPTSANASPQPRSLRAVASTSKLTATLSKIDKPSSVRRGPGSTVRITQAKDLPLKPRLEDVFKRPAARSPSRPARERTATSSSGSTYDGDQSTFRSSSSLSMTETIGSDENMPAPRQRKGPRPSLSDRTIESLASIPASPKVRRRSSFFTAQSPMAGSRPSSSMGQHGRQPSNALTQGFATVRPESPSKRSALERPPSSATVRASSQKIVSGSQTIGASRTPKPKTTLDNLFGKPSSAVKPTRSTYASAQKALKPPADAPETPRKVSTSSAALREQIRLAKQTHRNSPKRIGEEDFFPNYDQITDPFNQAPKEQESVLTKRIHDARLQGRLNIAAMGLKEVPDEILTMYEFKADQDVDWAAFVDLTKVVAADNEFEYLPDELFPDTEEDEKVPYFACVENLDLHGNHLRSINLGFRKLEGLTVLNLSRNRLANNALGIISQISNLRELRIAENLLEGALPASLSRLEKLEVLELQANKLTALPESLSELKNLRVLNVANNNLSTLPLNALENLPLVEVTASKNTLTGTLFSSSVACLAKLQRLDVSCNSLSALTKGNLYLPSLRELNVSFNRLTLLPAMTSWTSLTIVNAEDNNIESLPPGFCELQTVKSVNLTGNDIRKLDPEVALMEGLESLQLAANPMAESKFMSMTTEEVKRTLKSRLAVPGVVDPLMEMINSMGAVNMSR